MSFLALWFAVVLLSGEVRDAVTQAPIAGASIMAVGGSAVATTDSSGRFHLDVPNGSRIRVVRTGYVSVEFAPQQESGVQIFLTPVTHALEKMTITAIRGAADAGGMKAAPPITQTMIPVRELEQRYSGQEIPLLLSATPGITAYSDGGAYSNYTYFRIRGIDQTRINITLDGIPLNDAEDQGVFFSNFPDFGNSVQSVQVQRGVGTSSLGTAAYAGSVNFESFPLVRSRTGGELQLSRGAFNTSRASAEWQSMLSGRVGAYGRVSTQETDGYRHHSGNSSTGGFASAGYYGDRTIAKLVAAFGISRNQLSYLASSAAEIAADPRSNPLTDNDRFWQSVVGLTVTTQLDEQSTLGATVYNVSAGGDYDVTFGGDVSNFNLASTMTGMFGTFGRSWGRASLTIGAHGNRYHRDHFLFLHPDLSSRLYSNRGDKNELSAFAKLRVEQGGATWFADLQARRATFASVADRNAGIDGSDIDWTFVNPKVGVSMRVTPRTSWYASYGSNGREPTRNDMFAGFDNIDTTNAAFVGSLDRVRSERVRDGEVGVVHETGGFSISSTVFDMRFRNEITPIGELSYIGLPLRKNVRASFRQGVEVDAAYRGSQDSRFAASANGALTRSRIAEYVDDATGQTYRDVEPLLTPGFVANHRLSFAPARATWIHVDGRYVGSSFLANTGDSRFVLPAAYTMDGTLTLDLGRHAVLVQLRNLTDRRAYSAGYTDGSTSFYYVQAGRNLIATARLRF